MGIAIRTWKDIRKLNCQIKKRPPRYHIAEAVFVRQKKSEADCLAAISYRFFFLAAFLVAFFFVAIVKASFVNLWNFSLVGPYYLPNILHGQYSYARYCGYCHGMSTKIVQNFLAQLPVLWWCTNSGASLSRAGVMSRGKLLHAHRSRRTGSVQASLPLHRRRDGRHASPHRLLAEYQGASRLLLRSLRWRGRSVGDGRSHAGTPG